MLIRNAKEDDLEEILKIYNYEVEHGISTLDLHPKTLTEWSAWFRLHNTPNHPLLVAELDAHIAGYACLSEYRDKEAYQSTVEISVYVSEKWRQKGIATELMKAVLDIARVNETIHTVVSVITSGNEASVKLHQKYGFSYCGTIHEVGRKFGEYRDIENYELRV